MHVASPIVEDPSVNGISLSDVINNMETELKEAKQPAKRPVVKAAKM